MAEACSTEVAFDTVVLNGAALPVTKAPTWKSGKPKVKSHSSRVGSQVVITKKVDYTDAQGEMKLTIRQTKDHIERIEECQDNPCKNAIMIIDQATGSTRTFTDMSVAEDVEWDMEAEEVEVTFRGSQAK